MDLLSLAQNCVWMIVDNRIMFRIVNLIMIYYGILYHQYITLQYVAVYCSINIYICFFMDIFLCIKSYLYIYIGNSSVLKHAD